MTSVAEPFPARTDESSTEGQAGSSRRFHVLALCIVLISTLLQWGALKSDEVMDDHILLHNPVARGCGSNIIDCFRHPVFLFYYRPVMSASFSAAEALHGPRPLYAHLDNLALHAVVIALACWFFRLLLRRERPALLAGCLFALHPLQVGATTFIGGRTDPLALLFVFLFAIGLMRQGEPSHRPGVRNLWRVFSVAAFTLAVLAKEQCGLLVLLVPLFSACRADRKRVSLEAWMLVYLAPVVFYFVAAARIVAPGAVQHPHWSPALRIEIVGRTLWYYFKLVLFPTVRAIHQSTTGPFVPQQLFLLVIACLIGGIWLALMADLWPDRRMRLLTLWATVTLLPCLNIIPIPSQYVSSYRAYIPLVGFAGLAGTGLDRLLTILRGSQKSLSAAIACIVTVGVLLASVSLSDVSVWKNDLTLEFVQAHSDPNFLPAMAAYAETLLAVNRPRESLKAHDTVLGALFPDPMPRSQWAAYVRTPQMQSMAQGATSLRYPPLDFVVIQLKERAQVLQALGRWDEAAGDLGQAVAMAPESKEALFALVDFDIAQSRLWEAEDILRASVSRTPSAYLFVRLGYVRALSGRWREARKALEAAEAQPVGDPTRATAHTVEFHQLMGRVIRGVHDLEHAK